MTDDDPVGDAYRLIAAIHANTAASISASLTLQIMTGFTDEDCATIMSWVAHDPHSGKPRDFEDELAHSTGHIADFEQALWATLGRWGRDGRGLSGIPYEPSR